MAMTGIFQGGWSRYHGLRHYGRRRDDHPTLDYPYQQQDYTVGYSKDNMATRVTTF